MSYKILLFIILTSFFEAKGQIYVSPKHSIILDAGGIGGYGSLNYERVFFSKKNYHLSYKAGFSFFRFKDYERELNPDFLIPMSIQIIRRFKNHNAVLGVGNTVSSIVKASSDFSSKIRKTSLSGSLIIGYRFQKINKPFSIQFSYTPIYQQSKRIRHWGSLGFGYSFIKKNKS